MKKIGIFDSGIGGLSVVRKLLKVPGLQLLYYADTQHVPYGNRTQEEIQQLSYHAIDFLVKQHVDVIIIACYTVSTNALVFLQTKFPTIHFITVVDLVVEQLPKEASDKKIGILGTSATIRSQVLEKKLIAKNPTLQIIAQSCPELASAIEDNYEDVGHLDDLITVYCKPLQKISVEYVILGCTHYSLVEEIIHKVLDKHVKIITAEENIATILTPLLTHPSQPSTITWFVTANAKAFQCKAEKILLRA